MIGKVLTAKAAAIAGVLVLTGGVASAATGALPGPVQDTASHAVEHVGLHIPKSDDSADHDATDETNEDNGNGTTSTTVEHPDNHGDDVSTVAHDDSTEGADHGAAVCAVASDGKCKPNATDDNSGPGKSGDHRQDDEHVTTSTTAKVNDDSGTDDNTDDNSGSSSENSGKPDDAGNHGHGKSGHGTDD